MFCRVSDRFGFVNTTSVMSKSISDFSNLVNAFIKIVRVKRTKMPLDSVVLALRYFYFSLVLFTISLGLCSVICWADRQEALFGTAINCAVSKYDSGNRTEHTASRICRVRRVSIVRRAITSGAHRHVTLQISASRRAGGLVVAVRAGQLIPRIRTPCDRRLSRGTRLRSCCCDHDRSCASPHAFAGAALAFVMIP